METHKQSQCTIEYLKESHKPLTCLHSRFSLQYLKKEGKLLSRPINIIKYSRLSVKATVFYLPYSIFTTQISFPLIVSSSVTQEDFIILHLYTSAICLYAHIKKTCSTISGLYITLVPLYVTQSGEKHAQLYLVYILHWFPYM